MIDKKYFFVSYKVVFLILIINIPKINLIPIYYQGIRIEDILILLFVIINCNKIHLTKESIIILFYITFAYLLSFFHLFEFTFQQNYKHLYYLKFLEYFFLYSVLAKNIKNEDIIKVVIFSAILQLIISVGFYLGLPYQAKFTIDSRATGLTAGPWELSIIFSLFFFIFYEYYKKNITYIILFFIGLIIIILISYSRIALLGIFIIYLLFGRYRVILFSVLLLLILFLFFIDVDNALIQTNLGYFSLQRSLNFLQDFSGALLSNFLEGQFHFGGGGAKYDNTNLFYDASLVSRLQQWGRYLHSFTLSSYPVIAYLFGVGPGGSGDPHTDGMYIKILVDFGIVGSIIYFYLIAKMYIKNASSRPGWVFISICCLTIDFYWPTKIAYVFIMFIIFFNNKKLNAK